MMNTLSKKQCKQDKQTALFISKKEFQIFWTVSEKYVSKNEFQIFGP